MSAFADCLASALAQGALKPEEAERLAAMHADEMAAAARRGAADPAGEAKRALEATLDAEAKQALRRKTLQGAVIERLARHAQDYRAPNGKADVARAFEGVIENRNNLLVGSPSVVGRRDALMGMVHARVEALLYETRRKWTTGQRRGQASLDDMARAAFGDASNPQATAFVAAWRKANDELIDAFNAAGGAVAKRPDYFPQRHEARALLAAGRDKWMADIKPLLDEAKMRDPLTGGALTPARLDEALSVIWSRIVTDGASERAPSMQPFGRGSLAKQRAEERFLEFRDGEAWLAYHRAYGGNDVYETLMGHLRGLAKDVAALEVLGPNPTATVTWMQSVVAQEKGRHIEGLPSLYKAKLNDVLESRPEAFLGRLWDVANGPAHSPNKAADAVKGLRNWLTAANLGGTPLTAFMSDPMQARWAHAFAGVPAFRSLANLPAQLFSKAARREVERSGVLVADAMEHLRSDLGGYGLTAASREMARWLPDRVFTWSGLTPWTNGNRRTSMQSLMMTVGDHTGGTLADMASAGVMGDRAARWLKGFGVTERDWAYLRATAGLDHGPAGRMVRPVDVIDAFPGDAAAREAALRYSEAVHAFAEEGTPSGTARVRTIMGAHSAEGTVSGELTRSATMYMSYPTTVMISLSNAISHEMAQGRMRGLGFATAALTSLTLGGALILQMQALRNGHDAQDVSDPQFWGLALMKGGGLGFYGDWLLADYKRGGAQQAARVAGPVAGFVFDTFAVANPKAALDEYDDTNRAARAVELARRNTPVLTMWPIKPFADRLVFDRLQEAANPHAYRAWRRTEQRLQREEGQGTWWRRGEASPHRAPDLSLW